MCCIIREGRTMLILLFARGAQWRIYQGLKIRTMAKSQLG